MTTEEVRVWFRLRNLRDLGYHFRRQVPLDGYYPDFVGKKHRLIIEVDGSQHGEEPQLTHDRRRDAHFRAEGYRILRFWNSDVSGNLDVIVDTVLAKLAESG